MSTFLQDWMNLRAMSAPVGGASPAGRLIYDWEGADELVNNKWVDRVAGLAASASGNPQHGAGYYLVSYNDGYFTFDANSAAPNGLNIGRLWRVEVDAEIVELTTENIAYMIALFDFGSTGDVNHAFGLMYSRAKGNTPGFYFGDNYKAQGNVSTYASRVIYPSPQLVVGDRFIAATGCEAFDSSQDIQYVEYGGIKSYSATAHDPTTFNRNFNSNVANFGATIRWSGKQVKIYSIKIYNYD